MLRRARPIKVCHILYGLNIGGIETLAVKLVNHLDPDRFEQQVICLTHQADLVPQIRPGAAKIVHLDRRDGQDLRLYPRLRGLLASENPDVVHTRNWTTFLEGVIPALFANIRGRVHSFDGLNAEDLGPESGKRVLAQRLLMPLVRKIVARSEAMRITMCKQLHLPESRVELIADGIDLVRFDTDSDRHRIEIRRQWKIDPNAIVVGIVARLDPVKDHRTLIRGYVRALEQVPNLALMIVGGGPSEQELREEAAEITTRTAGRAQIIFTGSQLSVTALYHAMDIYAQPSLYEGVSGSILEAMAARLPVVATKVGGTIDIIHDGLTGDLVPVGDDQSLAARIVQLAFARTDRISKGKLARNFVEANYGLDQVLEKYARVYTEAAGLNARSNPEPEGRTRAAL